jgi:hypothetical protein
LLGNKVQHFSSFFIIHHTTIIPQVFN